MKNNTYLIKLKAGLESHEAGNKAVSLYFLKKNKFRIPETYVVKSHAFTDYYKNKNSTLDTLYSELDFLPPGKYAVRSSTNFEDSQEYSYAGQFDTYTNIEGKDALIEAIEKVWYSAEKGLNTEYHKSTNIDGFRCSVLIQEMIFPRLAGVSFSQNPVNNRNEIIIEAVEGPGEHLVQKGITPLRWRFFRGRIFESCGISQHESIVEEIATATRNLAKKFKKHVDVEWVYDGKKVYYLQLRQVTGKSELTVYSNKMAQEMLPGQIKPLVWSINIPLVNSTWIKILSEITGPLIIKPEDLARAFYFRTYFNINGLGKIFKEFGLSVDSLEFLLTSDDENRPSFKPGIKIFRHTFRIIKFLITKLRFERFYLEEYEELRKIYSELSEQIDKSSSISESYSSMFDKLYSNGQRLAYLNIIIPLLMQIYNKRLITRMKKKSIDYERIDFNKDFPELEKFNPMVSLNKIKEKITGLSPNINSEIKSYKDLLKHPEADYIKKDIDKFLKEFGHFSASGNDFSVKKWQEEPDIIFSTLLDTGLRNTISEKRSFYDYDNAAGKGKKLRKLYKKAGKYRIYREQISSLYTLGYGLFRYFYLKLSKELVEKDYIKKTEDIFYLYRNEVDSIVSNLENYSDDPGHYNDLISLRKEEMEETKDYILPAVIYGDDPPVLETGNVKNYNGVGTSSGQFTGITKVVKSLENFGQISKDQILIIPFSDVGWTPVLIQAGALVSESGGMLSHCSIVAREMGIPALVSVENACAIGDGHLATVDGSNGILTIHEYHASK